MDNYQNKFISEVDAIKENLKKQGWNELCIPPGTNAKEAAKLIIDAKTNSRYAKQGLKWFADFNCIIFYSTEELTERDILTAIYGCSPEEHEKREKEYFDEFKRKEAEFKRKASDLIAKYREKGHEILDSKFHERWDEAVPVRVGDIYHGMELQAALDVIELLNKGENEAAKKKLFGQGHSGMSASITLALIGVFCDNGKKFVKEVEEIYG